MAFKVNKLSGVVACNAMGERDQNLRKPVDRIIPCCGRRDRLDRKGF
jgi:hypothetical protein